MDFIEINNVFRFFTQLCLTGKKGRGKGKVAGLIIKIIILMNNALLLFNHFSNN